MNITINGKVEATQAATIEALIAELGLNTRQVAIELNREIVPRSAHGTTQLAQNDVVEVVAFIGGG